MSADGGKVMAPWVRRAWHASRVPGESLIKELTRSLEGDVRDRYPGVDVDIQLRGDNIIVTWSGPPAPDDLADALDVDPLLPSGGAFTATLYGEDLPEVLVGVTIVLRHRASADRDRGESTA